MTGSCWRITAADETLDALKQAVAAFGKGRPRIVISTHSHVEHLGGNAAFGQEAVIIAHRNMRERFVSGLYALLDLPREALPGCDVHRPPHPALQR